MVLMGAILFTVSEHSFVLTASKKLYLARTSKDNIFEQVEDKQSEFFLKSEKLLSNTEKTEIKKHKIIALNFNQSFRLFINRILVSCQKNRFFNILKGEDKQLLKLYNQAALKINNDLNVVKLIKNFRDVKILVNAQMMDRKVKF